MQRSRSLIKNFIQLYSLKSQESKSCEATYEETEKVWIEQTGKRFYKNYNSFNAARVQFNKKRAKY